MHEAYEVLHLFNVNTMQIEAIAAYENHLLVGTRQGHLILYCVSESNGNKKYDLQMLRLHKNFSKKPIQQIEVIPEENLLLCLTDNQLSTYDLNGANFPMVKTFPQTKGASIFALDNKSTTSMTGESNSVVRLCVAVRRKLQLYYGKNGEFKQHLFEFTIPDVPKIMSWGQQYLCVGFKSEYTLYDLSSGNPKELFPISSSRSLEPTIAKHSETCFVLGRDNTSVLLEEAKDIEIKKTIKWSEAPIAVVWDEPYILGLLQDQVVIQTVEPALFIQTLPDLNKARLMCRCKRGLIFVSSMGQVWCISAVDVEKQRQQLLKDKQFQIAIDLTRLECDGSTGKASLALPSWGTEESVSSEFVCCRSDSRSRATLAKQIRQGEADQPSCKYMERLECDGSTGKASLALPSWGTEESVSSEFVCCRSDSRSRATLAKQIRQGEADQPSCKYMETLSDCSPEEKKQKIYSIQNLYAHELFVTKAYSLSMKVFMKLNTDPAVVIALFPELDNKADPTKKKLKGKDLENALNALIEYLVELRLKIGQGVSEAGNSQDETGSQRNVQQQLELIDTTLLKCYLQTNDAFVAPLLRLNNCRLDEAERVLIHHGKHSELIILYQTKGQHKKALELLREQAKQPDSSLKGYHRTKTYLQQLGADHINLIFKFSDWILKEYPEEGLKIFTEDISEVENLPRPKILDFLLREHDPLVIPYLEHVIHTWNDTDSILHDALVTCYREKITVKKGAITEEEYQHIKQKLITFLEKSTHYTPERVILHFPNDSLFEERAVILGKLGRHEQALAIYVQILGDVDRAIRYCENVNQTPNDKNQDVYVILMRILMNPEQSALTGPLANVARHPKTAVADLETALNILEKHADKISPMKALSVLPDSVPLGRLKHFLESALDGQLTLKRQTQILKGLHYAEHLQVEELKQFHESKSVLINDYNVCPVCKKRFQSQSAFVRYPNGDIVHYSCRVDK